MKKAHDKMLDMSASDPSNLFKDGFRQATRIQPSFPNWEISFVSGSNGKLFQLDHRIQGEPLNLITEVRFNHESEGPPGHVHGGATAALIDEAMGILAWHRGYACMTQQLNIRYRKAIPLTRVFYLLTRMDAVHEKTVEISCKILDEDEKDYVEATGTFYRLTPEQLSRFAKKQSS